jgi:hypothetical protein
VRRSLIDAIRARDAGPDGGDADAAAPAAVRVF